MQVTTPAEILDFWRGAGPERWFANDPAFDAEIRHRFGTVHEEAARGLLDSWAATPDGALALIIILDQFSRNLYRNDPRAFAQDEAALRLAEMAIAEHFDRRFPLPERAFFYMPFMHAEDLAAQERCIALAKAAGDENTARYARMHRDVIAQFGRFPHRNAALGRSSTEAERRYLESHEGWW